MMEKNKLGGIDPTDKHLLERAKKADLVTLPPSVKGTNCYNCKFIDNKRKEIGFCRHPKVLLNVTERMCCALWDNKFTYRAFGDKDKEYD